MINKVKLIRDGKEIEQIKECIKECFIEEIETLDYTNSCEDVVESKEFAMDKINYMYKNEDIYELIEEEKLKEDMLNYFREKNINLHRVKNAKKENLRLFRLGYKENNKFESEFWAYLIEERKDKVLLIGKAMCKSDTEEYIYL